MKSIKFIFVLVLTCIVNLSFSQEEKLKFKTKWDNGLKIESTDENFKLKFGGRLMADYSLFHQNQELNNTFGKLEITDAMEIRRSRLFASGSIYKNTAFKLQIDFTHKKVTLKDVYIHFKNIPIIGNFQVGHFKEPFRLESLTTNKYIMFIERAFPTDFTHERSDGIMIFNDFLNNRLSAQLGYFKPKDNVGRAVTGRVTGLLINNEPNNNVLHVGAGFSHRKTESFSISAKPAHLALEYINTNDITNVKHVNLLSLESAYIQNSFSLQGEYISSQVKTNLDTYSFSSYYGQASYFLTGESRNIASSYHGFGRVKPSKPFGENGGLGAWEVALRFASANLDSKTIFGGKQENVTLGITWYLNSATRIKLNNVLANVKGAGKANVFQVRFQIDF
ncbi:OprO/OprP family phosphate-selective porin [Gelatiniphilus marinus]|uniref:OprO/OprP family phosphate-selective porin n=1 Tax=Gelatiniphilus marinus TaxID=1759464 RepID=A0ABW5JVR3_9FLAO